MKIKQYKNDLRKVISHNHLRISDIKRGLTHSNNLVHCDIKGLNILIGKDCVKIGDLGCTKLDKNKVALAFSGTPVFMAPEVTRGEEHGFPADVWALGCTIIEMATGSSPRSKIDDPIYALYRIGYIYIDGS